MDEADRPLIDGVQRYELDKHSDDRGDFVELFRDQWFDDFKPVQWNYVRSAGNVLRGFHCHVRHTDLLAMVTGTMTLGLKDLRDNSPTAGRSQVMTLRPTSEVVLIPPGVGHGFYFPQPAVLVYSVSHEWDTDDELGCNWADPDLGLDWGCETPQLSDRDRLAGSLSQLRAEVRDHL
jgi:dTDP-4-dehydrorhamnose 3,5-epimerase